MTTRPKLVQTDNPAISKLITDGCKPFTVIGNEYVRSTFDDKCLQQAINSRMAPGIEEFVLNPDAHLGYGAPVGCVMASPSHIYPGPVGVDIKCSMSLLQLDLPADQITDVTTRRAIIDAILERIPTGVGRGQQHVPKSRRLEYYDLWDIVTMGLPDHTCGEYGIPLDWINRCEDSCHNPPDNICLAERYDEIKDDRLMDKVSQLGSYGGGNHFGECEVVRVMNDDHSRQVAKVFGLRDGCVAFLSHCGSRGFGHLLATGQFKSLQQHFDRWSIPYPGNDKELVYAPLGTQEADNYIADMCLGANYATFNHMLINTLVLEAFQQVFPGVNGDLVYFISHNIARQEVVNNRLMWVMRKGSTRAFPAGHHSLAKTDFRDTGHPILLPGDPVRGSSVMVALPGVEKTCYSINHGAGRVLGRKMANRTLDQSAVNDQIAAHDIITNCRNYPRDESSGVYKDFGQVIESVETAGLAKQVASLQAKFVIKDNSEADD